MTTPLCRIGDTFNPDPALADISVSISNPEKLRELIMEYLRSGHANSGESGGEIPPARLIDPILKEF